MFAVICVLVIDTGFFDLPIDVDQCMLGIVGASLSGPAVVIDAFGGRL
jgi:hypothetical protein